MVNLSNFQCARKPLLIYGVKRGQVPTKLRPHVLSKRQDQGRAACVDEMFKLLGCWKRSGYDDNRCSSEVKAFMNCAARQQQQKSVSDKSNKSWTQAEVNSMLKHYTEQVKKPRTH